MKRLTYFLNKFRRSELAQGLVEYAIILALISAVTVGALGGVGSEVNKTLDKSANPEVTVKVEKGYIPIASAEDMNNIRNGETHVFGKGSSWEGTYTSGLDKKYIQVADINLSKLDWDPIDEFTGTYEGSGLSIRNLKVDSEGSSGLFGEVQGAKLQDINLEDVSVQGTDSTGGLVGNATQASSLDRISVTGLVKHKGANKSLGGIAGELSDKSRLTNSYVDVKIDGNDNVGALVGQLKSSTIYQSYAHGTLDGKDSIGGLVGIAASNSQISQAYANVRLKGTDTAVGGLVGKDEGASVKQSHWDVETSGLKETANGKGEGNTSYEMTLARTYKDWDFKDVWKIKEGETYPSFDGENTRLNEITITFIGDKEKEYIVTGLVGSTLEDYHEGEIPEPTKTGSTFVGWEDEKGKDFAMDTKLGDKELKVTPKWELNEVVTKTFYPSEEMEQKQTKSIEIEDMHELVSYDVDKGKIDLLNRTGGLLEFDLSGRPYDRRVQTGGEEILADSKEVTAQNSSSYNEDGYKGTLEQYVYSGSYTPADTKEVSAQESSNYDSGGYKGTLTRYLYGGIAGDSKTVTNQTSSNYNNDGYTGTLSSYVYSGSYTPSDTQYVSGQTSSYYNSGGYTGTLSQYVYSGSYTPSYSKTVYDSRSSTSSSPNFPSSISYNSGGYSGTLTKSGSQSGGVVSGSAADSYTHNWNGTYTYNDWNWYTTSGWSWNKSTTSGYKGDTWTHTNGEYSGTMRIYDLSFISKQTFKAPSNPKIGQTYISMTGIRNMKYSGTISKPDTRRYSYSQNYSGTVSTSGSDTRVYRYQGNVTRPASDTRVYRYEGTVRRPDTQIYRYQGTVTKDAVDTRVYRYRGTVNRPYSDTRIWDYYYKYGITVSYRPK